MNTHTCIKPGCGTSYEDTDVEAYYCPSCNDERKEIAKQVDARLQAIPKTQHLTPLQAYDAATKMRGFVHESHL